MSKLLASVKNQAEALMALHLNVDMIDLKNPDQGALGALDAALIHEIIQSLNGQCSISATIGDLPMQVTRIVEQVSLMTTTGVDFIKIGFFPSNHWSEISIALRHLSDKNRLIAVLFADTQPDFGIIEQLQIAGFAGIMLDTMNKTKGSLTHLMPMRQIKTFVECVKANAMLCGLAGSLNKEDVPALQALHPDYLGFRRALCHQHQRNAQLDPAALAHLRAIVHP